MEVNKPCPGQGLGRDKFSNNFNGFTLIELLIILSVLSILALNIFPNLTALLAQERSVVVTNSLASTLAYARSESVNKHKTIITCQSNNGSECNKSGNWHNGWIVFADLNANKQRDPDENLLHVTQPVSNGTQATFRGSAGIRHYVKYKPDGEAFPNGSFLICHPGIGTGKALIITHSGRVRLSKVQTNGSAITCH
jgi:type IV fimbrial biogenesis protein FimT